MAVLERSALADSPLADLHAIASELGVDGFRRLRRDDLIDAILAKQGGDDAPSAAEDDESRERPRRRRGGRGRAARDADADMEAPRRAARPARPARDDERDADEPRRSRGGRGRGAREAEEAGAGDERTVEGTIELLPNGSAFARVAPPDTSDDDVYVSAAQVRRCELVAGDRVSGPVRPPRRSERHPSLVRIETVNGKPADQAPEPVRFDELPATFPSQRFALDSEDPALKAIEFLTPIGKGSRVTIAGPARTGKSDTLRRIAAVLAATEGLECSLVLAGVRPEEQAEWAAGPLAPSASLSFAATAEAQAQAVERAIDQGKRVAARGEDAVVLVDTLDGLPSLAARKALAAARNLANGGSLTVIATASTPFGGETTVVALDAQLAGAHRFPAIDLLASGTLRPELLVGDAGAEAIAEARAEA
jgi:transcription termination factor Rho